MIELVEKILRSVATMLLATSFGCILFYYIAIFSDISVPPDKRYFLIFPAIIWATIGIYGDQIQKKWFKKKSSHKK